MQTVSDYAYFIQAVRDYAVKEQSWKKQSVWLWRNV